MGKTIFSGVMRVGGARISIGLAFVSVLGLFLAGCGSPEVGQGEVPAETKEEVPTETSSPETAATPAPPPSPTKSTAPETTTEPTTPATPTPSSTTAEPTTLTGEDSTAFTATRTLPVTAFTGIRTPTGSPVHVLSVAFSPDGRLLAGGGYDTTVKLWDAQSGELLRTLTDGHRDAVGSVAFSSDGRLFASSGTSTLGRK